MLNRLNEPRRVPLAEPVKNKTRPLAAGWLSGKQRIGIDRAALVPTLARPHAVDGKMEMRTGGVGVAAEADIADRRPAADLLALVQPRRVSAEVRIIIA